MIPKNMALGLLAAIAVSAAAHAVETARFGDFGSADFEAGEKQGVCVDDRQRVVLADEQTELLSGLDHAWCAVVGRDGAVYAGTVPDGKIHRMRDGKAEVLFETGEAGVFSIAVLDNGTVIAGTGSEGKVWRVSPDGTGEILADLEENYVFALAVEQAGTILAATGGAGGRVYRLGGKEPQLVYESPGAHLMALAIAAGKIYAASGDRGAVYELADGKEARVLFSAPQGVVQALAVGGDGTVYAATAAIAEAKPGAEEATVKSIISELQARRAEPPASPTPPTPPAKREYKTTNTIYAITPAGEVREKLEMQGALFLTLLLDGKRILAGTAGKAGIYSVPVEQGRSSLIYEAESEQVHALAARPAGGFVAALGMPGRVLGFSGGRSRKGSFTSRVLSADHLTRWGTMHWRGAVPTGTKITFEARCGNSPKPDTTWTDWGEVALPPAAAGDGSGWEGPVSLPPARYIQYRAHMATASPEATPAVEQVSIAGLAINLAPEISEITAGTKEVKKAGSPGGAGNAKGNDASGAPGPVELSATATISWKVKDANGDKMRYRLEFRDAGMRRFIELEEELSSPQYKWDTTTVPDGRYYFRVTASDAPANPPGTQLETARVEGPFTVDNTGPVLSPPEVKGVGAGRAVAIDAADEGGTLAEAFWSVDGGEWRAVFPVDGIFDSPREKISVTVEEAEAAIVVIRVIDRAGNSSAVKAILESER